MSAETAFTRDEHCSRCSKPVVVRCRVTKNLPCLYLLRQSCVHGAATTGLWKFQASCSGSKSGYERRSVNCDPATSDDLVDSDTCAVYCRKRYGFRTDWQGGECGNTPGTWIPEKALVSGKPFAVISTAIESRFRIGQPARAGCELTPSLSAPPRCLADPSQKASGSP
jgi:hypothetical protein